MNLIFQKSVKIFYVTVNNHLNNHFTKFYFLIIFGLDHERIIFYATSQCLPVYFSLFKDFCFSRIFFNFIHDASITQGILILYLEWVKNKYLEQ